MNRRHFFASASRYSAGVAGLLASGGLILASESKPHGEKPADKGHGEKKPAEKAHGEKPHAPKETKAPPANPAAAKPTAKPPEKPAAAPPPKPAPKAARKSTRPRTAAKPAVAAARPRTAEAAFQELKAGNQRYISNRGGKNVRQTAGGKDPYAVVLTCADSRVAPEVAFDQGLGDLFTIRVAGNVANSNEIASIEYAVNEFGAPLVVVMGHGQCNSVRAAVESGSGILRSLRQAFLRTRASDPGLRGKPLLSAVTQMNVWQSIEDMLKGSADLRERLRNGDLKIIGANFQPGSGEVSWLGPHPDECDFV
jgi:carbonic anhydrase